MLEGGPKLDLVVDNVSFAYASRSILDFLPYPGGTLWGSSAPTGRKSTLLKNMSRVPSPKGAIYLGRRTRRRCPGASWPESGRRSPGTMVNFAFTVEKLSSWAGRPIWVDFNGKVGR